MKTHKNLHARASSSWIRQRKPTGFANVLEGEKMRPDVIHLRGENPPLQFGQISRRAHSACGRVPQGSSHLQVGWTQRCQHIGCCGNRRGRELKSLYYIVKMSHDNFLLNSVNILYLVVSWETCYFLDRKCINLEIHHHLNIFLVLHLKIIFNLFFYSSFIHHIQPQFPWGLSGKRQAAASHWSSSRPLVSSPPLLLHACLPTHATQVTSGMWSHLHCHVTHTVQTPTAEATDAKVQSRVRQFKWKKNQSNNIPF